MAQELAGGSDPSILRQTLSIALPVLGGGLASMHPAAARGLYGLTHGIGLAANIGELRRKNQERQAGEQAFANFLGSQYAPATPPVPEVTGIAPGPDPSGYAEEDLPGRAAIPGQPSRAAMSFRDVLGPQAGVVEALGKTPEGRKEAYGIIAKATTPEQFKLGEDIVERAYQGGPYRRVYQGRPAETLDDFVKAAERIQAGGGGPAPVAGAPVQGFLQPGTTPDTGGPGPRTSIPQQTPLGGGATTLAQEPTAPAGPQRRPAPRVTIGRTSEGKTTLSVAPGQYEFDVRQESDPARPGRTLQRGYLIDKTTGQLGGTIELPEGPLGEAYAAVLREALTYNVQPGTAQFYEVVNNLTRASQMGGPEGNRLRDALRRKYGEATPGIEAPGAPPPAPTVPSGGLPVRPGAAAPAPTGALPSYEELRRQGAAEETAEAGRRAGVVGYAGEQGRYAAQQQQELGPKGAEGLVLPNGMPVPPTWTQEMASRAGAQRTEAPPPAERKQLAETEARVQAMNRLMEGFKRPENRAILGTIRFGEDWWPESMPALTRALAQVKPGAMDDEQREFLATYAMTAAQIRRELLGLQQTNMELASTAPALMKLNDPAEAAESKLRALKAWTLNNRDALVDTIKKSGVRAPILESLAGSGGQASPGPAVNRPPGVPTPIQTGGGTPAGQAPATHRYNPKSGKIEAIPR